MIALADAFDLPLNATYGAVNEPIYFTVSRADVFEGSLVMATMASEDPEERANSSVASSLDTSQSNSTFRSTEDLLLGHHSRVLYDPLPVRGLVRIFTVRVQDFSGVEGRNLP